MKLSSKIPVGLGKKLNPFQLIIFWIGATLFLWSWISEIYFHEIAGFKEESVGSEVFWRAEKAELVNSLFLLIGGLFLMTFAFFYRKR